MYVQGFRQNVALFPGFVAEVVTDSAQLNAFGSDGIHGVVVALDQLVPVQSVELGLSHCGLEGTKYSSHISKFSIVSNHILPKSIFYIKCAVRNGPEPSPPEL